MDGQASRFFRPLQDLDYRNGLYPSWLPHDVACTIGVQDCWSRNLHIWIFWCSRHGKRVGWPNSPQISIPSIILLSFVLLRGVQHCGSERRAVLERLRLEGSYWSHCSLVGHRLHGEAHRVKSNSVGKPHFVQCQLLIRVKK